MLSIAAQIEAKISYGLLDWVVTRTEQREVIALLRRDGRLPATLTELHRRGSLKLLIRRVSEPESRRELLDIVAASADATNAGAIRSDLADLDVQVASGLGGAASSTIAEELWQVRFNLIRLGVPAVGRLFAEALYRPVIPRDIGEPFTGQGATGVRPDSRSVPLSDQWSLWRKNPATTRRYSNPLGNLPQYLASIGASDRVRQAELLLKRPITTVMPGIWGPHPPSRAEVLKVAARLHGHEPALVAAFLLSEQRDQSGLEDAKDYASATSPVEHNASLGLGQVVVSTATRHSLLSDAISSGTMLHSSHAKTARLLIDDALNIFAVAKYLRILADEAARRSIGGLPVTQSTYPGINMGAYGRRFAALPADNIRALGSEYTSRAWDDVLSVGWGEFVYEAYRDVKAARVFP
ncbi:hypothetical protein HI113_20120 [Corallococcus exiguus]|uniref:hypothetical protein n=1 Tax=Corallococcus exiguus TaxID=83462 RepID=UPI0014735738|nr:hypothetical protein [Corallococcus exiguus]NNB96207.1 hypothetical protein [Corallococcus exiguus]